ncbi:MAG TPA: hypothetical protein VFY17_09580 [Pilimelia sp.]|nr:hypothetical protein [Pilimelia sp.]
MTDAEGSRRIGALLDEVFVGQERVSRAEIYQRAVAEELPGEVLDRVGALPEGEYTIDEAAEALGADAAI